MQSISDNTSPTFYSVEDIQHLLGIGRNSAYRLVSEKDFPAFYVGNRIIIPTDLFQKWVIQQAAQPVATAKRVYYGAKRKGGGVNGECP